MIVSIHQPNFMPWLGYFHKIAQSDVFVLIDQVRFVKGHIVNRNKIKNNHGEAVWLTVPIRMSKGSAQNINEIEVDPGHKWRARQYNLLRAFYQKTPFFDAYFPEIKELLQQDYESLAGLNIAVIRYFCSKLNIATKLVVASELGQEFGAKNDLNLNICSYFNADIYLSGTGAKKYNDESLYEDKGMKIVYQEFQHPTYTQPHGDFLSHLSALDALFNCGAEQTALFMS